MFRLFFLLSINLVFFNSAIYSNEIKSNSILFSTDEYISKVQFGSIQNQSLFSKYTDYSHLSASLIKGLNYNINIHLSNSYKTNKIKVWIDWNQDGDFLDLKEDVSKSIDGKRLFSGDITPPKFAFTGKTKMRIKLYDINFITTPTTFIDSFSGEVEDYSLRIFNNLKLDSQNSNQVQKSKIKNYSNYKNELFFFITYLFFLIIILFFFSLKF
jgi:hypothetical protein